MIEVGCVIARENVGKARGERNGALLIALEKSILPRRTHVYHRLGDNLVFSFVEAGRVHGCEAELGVFVDNFPGGFKAAVAIMTVANGTLPGLNVNPAFLATGPVLSRPGRCLRPSEMLPSISPCWSFERRQHRG